MWASPGFKQSEDTEIIERFTKLLEAYDIRAEIGARVDSHNAHSSPFGQEIVDIGPLSTKSLSIARKIRLAAYSAYSVEALGERLSLLMHVSDASELTEIIEHFQPRFLNWWENSAHKSLSDFQSELSVLWRGYNKHLMPAVAHFYGLTDQQFGAPLIVHLMAHPLSVSQTNGNMVENHSVIEVLSGETAENRVGVIIHEIAHYFFKSAPLTLHTKRLNGALRARDPRASAALGLMNEALATAIGNGIVEQGIREENFKAYFNRPRSFYLNQEIDTAAKTILPLVTEYIATSRTIDSEFLDQYYDLLFSSLGEELNSVSARLRVSAYIATSTQLNNAAQGLPSLLGINSLYGSNLEENDTIEDAILTRHSYLNGFLLARKADYQKLAAILPNAENLRVFHTDTVDSCIYRRDSAAVLYVIAINQQHLSSKELKALIDRAKACELN